MAVLKLSPRFAAGLVLLACIVASARGADVTLAPRSIANQSGAAVETGGTRWIGTGANATASRLGCGMACLLTLLVAQRGYRHSSRPRLTGLEVEA